MPEGNSLINLGNLSKPATVLIKKISNAIGVLYEPRRIIKKAEAEAEAEKINALASIELNELQQRAINRFVHQETRKQENIEHITSRAISSLEEDANVENLDEDWLAHFFKNCDTVSDQDMQLLWANLLSSEASRPGTFSKRTVDFVASMDKSDAHLFTNFCQFVWHMDEVIPVIFDNTNDLYEKSGVTFSSLKHLEAIGLVSFETAGYVYRDLDKHTCFSYFDTPVKIEFKEGKGNDIPVGEVLLTQVGKELTSICGANRNEKFFQYVIDKWKKESAILSISVT